jgi:hypothetical protein
MVLGDAVANWSLGISAVGLIATVVGFSVALYQIRRTRTAAEAAATATAATAEALRRGRLLVLLPQLQSLEGELHFALQVQDAGVLRITLGRWRYVASQAEGLLSDGTDHELSLQLKDAIALAASAESRLAGGNTQLTRTTASAMKAIREATSDAGAIASRMSQEV